MSTARVYWRATGEGARLVIRYPGPREPEFYLGGCDCDLRDGTYTVFVFVERHQSITFYNLKSLANAKEMVESKAPWGRWSGEKMLQLDKMLPLPGREAK